MENTFNSRKKKKNDKIFSSYTENTLYCSDVYKLAQKLDNSLQIVKLLYWSRMTEERVGELFLA